MSWIRHGDIDAFRCHALLQSLVRVTAGNFQGWVGLPFSGPAHLYGPLPPNPYMWRIMVLEPLYLGETAGKPFTKASRDLHQTATEESLERR